MDLPREMKSYFTIFIIFSPDVNFCGYTVPHPADTKMHLRIQTSKNVRAVDVLRRGLNDLEKLCDHTITTFENAYREHQEFK